MNDYSAVTISNWRELDHVNVDVNALRLAEHAEERASRHFHLPRWDTKGVHPENNLAFASHDFWHNVVNFAFGHPYTKDKEGKILKFRARDSYRQMRQGAYAMGACFYRQFGERPILAKDMLPFTESLSKVKNFFKGAVSIPLIGERWKMLREAVSGLERYFEGNPNNILEEGNYRAFGTLNRPGIVDILISRFPLVFGSDTAIIEHGGKGPLVFYFDKRAQLFVLIYEGRAAQSGEELKRINDIEEVGPIADYELPKAFHTEGILIYGDELKAKIEKREPIEPNSLCDIEIRGALSAALAGWLTIVSACRKERNLSPIHIGHADYFWWESGRRAVGNHHVCLTTSY